MNHLRQGSVLATIANGASVTAAIDLGDARLAGIFMPPVWTAAAITFDVSYDGSDFKPWYLADGTEYAIAAANAVQGRFIQVSMVDFLPIRRLKIRSGLASAVIAQGAARELYLLLAS